MAQFLLPYTCARIALYHILEIAWQRYVIVGLIRHTILRTLVLSRRCLTRFHNVHDFDLVFV